MTELRIATGFSGFDEPVEPDTAFAEQLYAKLIGQLGLGAAGARRESPAQRGRRRLAGAVQGAIDAISGLAAPRWRRAWQLAVVAALLVALVVATLFVGSMLHRPRSAAELVARSQAAYRTAPALTMTGRGPDLAEFRMRSDGRGTWRVELDAEPGTFSLYDGVRSGRYNAEQKTWGSGPESERGGPPFPFNAEFTWAIGEYTEAMTRRTMPCAGADDLGEAVLIGRPVDRVRCPDADIDFWLDKETGLILRLQAGPAAAHWDEGAVMEVITFRMGLDDPGAFSWSGPPGAFDENAPPPSTELVVGDVAPPLTATTLDGTTLDTRRLARPIAVLFCARYSCRTMIPEFEAAASAARGVDAFVVELEYQGTVAGSLAAHPVGLPVIVDEPPGMLTQSWGLGFPETVFLAADGTVRGILAGRYAAREMQRAFAALVAGEPVPSLEPPPLATPWPMPSVFEFGELSSLSRGAVFEAWTAPLLDGGRFESASLAGRPSVVWFWGGGLCDGCFPGQLEAFEAAVHPFGERLGVVVVVQGEQRTGDVRRQVQAAGMDVPVAMDWDGTVDPIYRLGVLGCAFIVDPAGRLVDVTDGPPTAAHLIELFPALEAGSPKP